jgi:hypothetical protein
MPDKDGTPDLEGSVAPTLATIDAELLPAVMDFARQVAHRLGPSDWATEHTRSRLLRRLAPTSSNTPSIQPRQGSTTSSKAAEGSRRRVGIPSFPDA